ncbi:MAG: hypothetical protein ACON4K_10290 [Akkermansiaceae bacterium]
MNKVKITAGLTFALFCSAHAATTAAVADTIILSNGTPTNTSTQDGEANFGGRNELIIGATNPTSPRLGLVRFNVSAFAAEINAGQSLTTARLILSERSGRNGNNNALSSTITVSPVVSQNEGWLEGTRTGSSNAFDADTIRSVSRSYLGTPSALNALDGTRWHSQGGGATTNPPFGAGSIGFTLGVDSSASVGTLSHTFDSGNADETLGIDLDLAGIEALLPAWLSAGNSNAGLVLEATGTNQLFFGSIQSGAADAAPVLELEFAPIPEPGTALLSGIAALCLVRRHR